MPYIIGAPFLLLKGDGFFAIFIVVIVNGAPPHILGVLLPGLYRYGQMTEKEVIKSILWAPIAFPVMYGLFWSIAPHFITSVTITLTRHDEWLLVTSVIPFLYSMLYLSGNIIRKRLIVNE